ncbi:hypothetical protein IQ06DRAFT_301687 [Phaeosphaeriaceae sp. SRC1lsM3a]|nr:hypothetical protein IQ06DRAFT_301687 [Stagonospora sp. SRC1lsM3a]
MRFTRNLITLFLCAATNLACECSQHDESALWVDTEDPSARVNELILLSGGSHIATTQGKMVVAMFPDTPELRSCLGNYATAQQSRRGDFLWSAIRCRSGNAVGAVSIVA